MAQRPQDAGRRIRRDRDLSQAQLAKKNAARAEADAQPVRRARPRLILFNKPFDVLCQFTPEAGHPCLADCVPITEVYPAGRLDHDSEGLVLLTNAGPLQAFISDPRHKMPKIYWVQVEGVPTPEAISTLCTGVELKEGITRPAQCRIMKKEPAVAPRVPPIRTRLSIPTTWIELILKEGRNRQVRRMTAAVGFPTLRLIRAAIGPYTLEGLEPGQWREVPPPQIK